MADMLVPIYMSVDLDFISEVVLLVVDLWVRFVLRSKVWSEDSVPLISCSGAQGKNTDLCAISSSRFIGTSPS